ncbi:MAG: Maf family protein [Chitinispirillia bacterium]|nr:Maf family protein [Chitinispirillia bacterium]MCL2268417.1 Maf family protein [Chitinispirillia bacterium]
MILLRDIKRPIILASGSPRRSQILTMMGVSFELAKSGVEDEDAYLDVNDLDNSLCRLACAKAEDASKRRPEALVLGADTTVVTDDSEIIGKAADKADAARMLRTLSGRSHTVITATALLCGEVNFRESVAVHTQVFFRDLDEEEIWHYLSFPEYEDKAGAYAVQGGAMTFIDKIEGCYYNVMGLPVTATLGLLKKFIRKETDNGRQ